MTPHEWLSANMATGIAVMVAVTLLLRLGGFWLMGFVRVTPRLQRMLDALPGSVIVASVVPVAVNGGIVGILAIGAAVATMIWQRNDFLAVIAGMVVAAAARAAGISG